MIPPPGAAIAASYDHGGGRAGNVAAGTITSPHSPAPFVQAVTNPIPAGGGADAEDADDAGLRGPFALRSLGRALTASDYEWLAREASTEVARSRCLPLTGANGRQSAGRVSVLVVPQSLDGAPMPTQTLLETVRDYLAARCPASVAGQVRIVSPAYLAISVVGAVAVPDPGAAAAVEADVRSHLNAFLHPLSGGPGGRGWDFGQPVALSQIVAAAREVSGVAYVEHFELVVDGLVAGDVVTLQPDQLPVAGAHQIKVRPAVRR
jgi:predicted phage baseplate assembly protein